MIESLKVIFNAGHVILSIVGPHRCVQQITTEVEKMGDLTFDDVEVGHTGVSGTYRVTKEEIVRFAKQYDPRPFHIDEAAASHSVFGELTASSAHTIAIATALTIGLAPWLTVLAGLQYDEMRFPDPVRPGDVLKVTATVMEKRESKSRPDKGIVRCRTVLSNTRGETLLDYVATLLVVRRPK